MIGVEKPQALIVLLIVASVCVKSDQIYIYNSFV